MAPLPYSLQDPEGTDSYFLPSPTLLNFPGNVSFLARIVSAIENLLMTSNYPVLF